MTWVWWIPTLCSEHRRWGTKHLLSGWKEWLDLRTAKRAPRRDQEAAERLWESALVQQRIHATRSK